MHINIKRFYRNVIKKIDKNCIRIFFLFTCAIILYLFTGKRYSLSELIDITIVISALFLLVCEIVANFVNDFFKRRYEDKLKLPEEYESLVNKYSLNKEDMIKINEDYAINQTKGLIIPEICICKRRKEDPCFNFTFRLNEKDGMPAKYQLPKQIANSSSNIFPAHSKSVVYNNICVRANDIDYINNYVLLDYEITTYFDSLITNRAIDYEFQNTSRTIREIYEPGPILSPLRMSKLSNHLGFNGFVELNDENIIFVKRSKNVSIGKHKLQQSIGASLKTKYCLDKNYKLTKEGLDNAIRMEIHDELKLDINDDYKFSDGIFAFYRDIVEGGKPQFLFYYKDEKHSSLEFERNFKEKIQSKQGKLDIKKNVVDGKEFAFLNIKQLKSAKFDINKMIIGKDEYEMEPSSIASIMLFIEYLG